MRFLPERNRKTFCETIEAEKVSGIKFQSYASSRNFEIVSSSFRLNVPEKCARRDRNGVGSNPDI